MPVAFLAASDRRLMSTTKPLDLDTAEARQKLRSQLAAARQGFIAGIERGAGGLRAHVRFADGIDALIRDIVQSAYTETTTPVAVVAIGGYGRQALCLYSDIDLLLVFRDAIGVDEERFVKAVLHPLWDLGLTVGHQVRVLSDFDEVERDNPEYLMALLDARLLAGDAAVFDAAQARFRGSSVERREEILEALLQLMEERHARFNTTIYQLEPDIKDSPGGLRDIAAARVFLSLADGSEGGNAIEHDRLEQAEDFLLRVRSMLHLDNGRNVNILTHELQEKAAERLRYPGAKRQQRVEALMGAYFRQARNVARALERARRAAGSAERDTTRIALGLNLELTADGVGFVDEQRAASEPS
jgi:[protein-PII] uridylyltransferase